MLSRFGAQLAHLGGGGVGTEQGMVDEPRDFGRTDRRGLWLRTKSGQDGFADLGNQLIERR